MQNSGRLRKIQAFASGLTTVPELIFLKQNQFHSVFSVNQRRENTGTILRITQNINCSSVKT